MDELIRKILEIIKDYRREDLGPFYWTEINEKHIRTWIEQFDEEDREFLLSELLHLLPESYLSKEDTLRILGNEFETLKTDFSYNSVQDFLDETRFLDCQTGGKSQKIFLHFIDEILKEKYGYSLSDCGKKVIKNWIYFDDVLATGGNFKKDILKEIEIFGKDNFQKSGIRIIASFIILHSWGASNSKYLINLSYKLGDRIQFYRVVRIDNNPNINSHNLNPIFNHIYPIKSDLGDEILEFIENTFKNDYEWRNEESAFRKPDYPQEEKFFSSPENRMRYEKIILQKGYEIMKSIDNLNAKSLRPLGMTLPSNKTLGTGTHFFTWRNISNTCPIVFWWGSNNWYPLFPVKNRGGH